MGFPPEFMGQRVEETLISDINNFASALLETYPNTPKLPKYLSVGADISILQFSYFFIVESSRSDEGTIEPRVVRMDSTKAREMAEMF